MSGSQSDLDVCAREPIHVPGAIQPHGSLLVIDPAGLEVLWASANFEAITGRTPLELFRSVEAALRAWRASGAHAYRARLQNPDLDMAAHAHQGRVIMEFERSAPFLPNALLFRLTGFAQQMTGTEELADALSATARLIADLTGFDRALVYRFDTDWNGHVVAEAGNDTLPSYIDLRFPAADIPAQARNLYTLNRIRLIPDANYTPVPLTAFGEERDAGAIDMTFTQLRSVSPVHLEYMRNMGTLSSMSISVIVDGKLWGLLSCHSRNAHHVTSGIREACDFVVQSLAMRISADSRAETAALGVELARVHAKLLADQWDEGLAGTPAALLELTRADGAAILSPDSFQPVGEAPEEDQVRRLVAGLSQQDPATDFYVTDSIVSEVPQNDSFTEGTCGVLALRISEVEDSWLIWFRQEVVKTVTWGGDPHKVVRESGRIHPRKSFEAWREMVRGRSAPWHPAEIAAARDLRASIVEIVLKKAEQLARLAADLQKSNSELEAFSYSISHDLRAPFRHIVGFSQLLTEREKNLGERSRHYLQMISDSAVAAGELVDDLLTFSHLGRAALSADKVDMNKLVAEVRRGLAEETAGRAIVWQVDDLPAATGDATLLRQVWYNLIDNAVKYTRLRAEAHIDISAVLNDDGVLYRIADNGVGFDMAYKSKLFGVFQRLQRSEDFEGTGIGLALIKRIVERHGGSVDAMGTVDEGSCFTFSLPTLPEE
jgi:two-component system, chemotaxis family, sensor kinase Cph1